MGCLQLIVVDNARLIVIVNLNVIVDFVAVFIVLVIHLKSSSFFDLHNYAGLMYKSQVENI